MYKYILTGVDVASKFKIARALRTKKSSQVAILLEGGMFKYPKVFQCDNGSEFKSEVTKLLEKHIVDIRRARTKYKPTHTASVEALNKELAKQLFKPMNAQELQNPKKVLAVSVKYLNRIVNKISNEKPPRYDMKRNDAV